MYENGLAVDSNLKFAFNLYKKSLDNSKEPSSKIFFKLGNFYEFGLGMNNPNYEKSF